MIGHALETTGIKSREACLKEENAYELGSSKMLETVVVIIESTVLVLQGVK